MMSLDNLKTILNAIKYLLTDYMANGDKAIILTSSAADSTKKFKITVDDSGTLSATEVTA